MNKLHSETNRKKSYNLLGSDCTVGHRKVATFIYRSMSKNQLFEASCVPKPIEEKYCNLSVTSYTLIVHTDMQLLLLPQLDGPITDRYPVGRTLIIGTLSLNPYTDNSALTQTID